MDFNQLEESDRMKYESAEELASRNQISFREAYDSIRSYWTTER